MERGDFLRDAASLISRWTRIVAFPCLLLLGCAAGRAQTGSLLASPPPTSGMSHTEGTDDGTGIAWARMVVPAVRSATHTAAPDAWPMLTVQCSQDGERRRVDMLVDFGGADRGFHSTRPVKHAAPNPNANITLSFRSFKPFHTQWERLPSREYRYRNPSLGTSNLQDVSFFLQYMYATREVRVMMLNPSLGDQIATFPTYDLVVQVMKTPLCH
jgi:hypothetical protein